ncbi:MAG: hypothetical protein ACKVX7_04990 [Planctomycetota bacterium]
MSRVSVVFLAFIFVAFSAVAFGQNVPKMAKTNATGIRPLDLSPNVLTVGTGSGPFGPGSGNILYAPSEGDDPAYRAAISAAAGGATVDYFNATAATPDLATLNMYSAVLVWANFAFADAVTYGDNLADYVDGGGQVILGAFCTFTGGNSLAGQIMTPAYCPVVSPLGNNHFAFSPYVGDGVECIHTTPFPITAYDAIYRDFLVLQGGGIQDGSYTDGEIAHAFRPDLKVVYSNGNGGAPVLGPGQWAELVANIVQCGAGPVLCPAVTGLTCTTVNCTNQNIALAWTNGAIYTSIQVERDAVLIATLAGTATSYTDLAVPGGGIDYQYRVRGICAAGPAFAIICNINHCPCPDVTGVTCVSNCTNNNIALSWTNGSTYTSVEIERDAVLIATLPGGSNSYTDVAVPPAMSYNYTVRGICPFGPAPGANCFINHCFLGPSVLYCPSEADDPAYRAAIMALTGGPVDFFDASTGTPDVSLMLAYDVVYTWANFAYDDNVLMGDNLATYVDAGGRVILGAFCTFTSGNFLSGNIMTDAYCPVVSPAGNNHFSMSPYVGDGVTCIHTIPNSITNYDCTFRDFLVTQGTGIVDGTYADGEIAHAYRSDFAVMYSNGAGAVQLGCPGEWAELVANMVVGCGGPPPCCLPTVNLDCVLNCANGDVTMTWNNLSAYTNITIRRDGVTIATIGGGLTTYTDTTAPDGPHTFSVTGNCGPPCGTSAFTVSCSLTVVSTGSLPIVVWAAEGVDLVDSVAALQTALTSAGETFATVANLADIPCADDGTVLFAMIGTFPADHFVTAAEGQYLRDFIAGGGCLYIESGDLWGFQGGAGAFYNADGVGFAADGGDTFTGMTGFDFDVALCAGLDSTYNQAQGGNDWTDQLSSSAADEFGPTAGDIWQDNDEFYVTGVYYAAADPAGAVWNQSWEFGGYGGDQDALLAAILAAMPCSSGPPVGQFRRGDVNRDLVFNIADAVFLLSALFVPGSPPPSCQDSADINDDGVVNIADAVYGLSALFVPGSPPPPTPFPGCGSDGTADVLTCLTPSCP